MLRIAEHAELSDPGRQRRDNEDALHVEPPLFVVADGMGGAQAGEVASRLAVEAFSRLPSDGSAEERLAAAARTANERIHEMGRSHREHAGMGTTITAALAGEGEIAVAHVGDSRAYRLREGRLEPLTRDHTLVQALIDQGRLSEEGRETHPQRSVITRALGPEADVEIETHTYPARPGDVYLLCSDGLTTMVDEDTIARIIERADSLDRAAAALIDAANAAGGRDNISVVLFRVDGDEPPGADDGARPEGPPTAVAPVAPAPPRRVRPAPRAPAPRAPAARRRRRVPRGLRATLVALLIIVPILMGGWIASRAVYFVGTDNTGLVTVYRGLPYELPAGLKLYEATYHSGVPAAAIPTARRKKLLDHSLRSRNDAEDLVRRLELGRIAR